MRLAVFSLAVEVVVRVERDEELVLAAPEDRRGVATDAQVHVWTAPRVLTPAEPDVGQSIREPAALEGDRVELGADVLQLDDRARDPDALDVGDVLGAGQGCEDADDRDRDRELDECEAARATHGPPSGSGAS